MPRRQQKKVLGKAAATKEEVETNNAEIPRWPKTRKSFRFPVLERETLENENSRTK